VFFGSRSTDGETGCVPAAVAELLGLPLLSAPPNSKSAAPPPRPTAETESGYVTYECSLPAACR